MNERHPTHGRRSFAFMLVHLAMRVSRGDANSFNCGTLARAEPRSSASTLVGSAFVPFSRLATATNGYRQLQPGTGAG